MMRRATLRLESLDGRVVPSSVSGDVLTIHRGDYLMGSASGAGGDIIRGAYGAGDVSPAGDAGTDNGGESGHVLGLGSKPGGTGDGVVPLGGRTGIGGEV
jgi:hypothetical protein